jgi:hemerythrin-like domain-containing protein
MSETRLAPAREALIRLLVEHGGGPNYLRALLAELDAVRRERDEADAALAEMKRQLHRERVE